MAIGLSLVALFFWGFSDYIGGIVTKTINPVASVVNREALGIIVYVVLIGAGVHSAFRIGDIVLAVIAGCLAAMALPLFFKVLAGGQMGIIAPITGTVSAAVPVVAGLFDHERPSWIQIVGIVIALIGVGFISAVEEEQVADSPKPKRSWLGYDVRMAIVCGLCFGTFLVLIHHTSKASGLWPTATVSVTMIALLTIYSRISGTSLKVQRSIMPMNLLGSAFDIVAFVSFTYATRQGYLSITGVISSLYPAVTVVLAAILLREKFGRLHRAGLVLSVISLGLISAG